VKYVPVNGTKLGTNLGTKLSMNLSMKLRSRGSNYRFTYAPEVAVGDHRAEAPR
jgi:hypothetical protein